MPKVNIIWYQPIVRRIYRDVKALKREELAQIENITHQAVSDGFSKGKYEKSLTKWVQILDKAGYEIREKE